MEVALRDAKAGLTVSIVCPTGTLVHSFKSRLPDVEGIENIQVDTIHGVLKYKRPGADQKVVWTPPTALRKVDVFGVDEGSQYDDQEVQRFSSVLRSRRTVRCVSSPQTFSSCSRWEGAVGVRNGVPVCLHSN